MILNELTTLPDIINNIGTLSDITDEDKTIIVTLIKTKYGSRTVFDSVTLVSSEMCGKMIDLMYARKWAKAKEAIDADVKATYKTIDDTETKTTTIYGFDGDGTTDNKVEITHKDYDEPDNVYDRMKQGLDFYSMFSYYNIIIHDIVHELTNSIY